MQGRTDIFMKRQRGRGRKPGGGGGGGGGGGNHPNRTLESNGPDVKIRGSASHIYEKYIQLSRDASSSGDRIMSESYAQHAEHYFRMLRAMAPQTPVYEPQRIGHDLDFDQEEGGEGDSLEEGEANAEGGEQPYPQQHRQPYQGGEGRQDNRQGGEGQVRQDRGGFRQHSPNYRGDRSQPRAYRGEDNRNEGHRSEAPRAEQPREQREASAPVEAAGDQPREAGGGFEAGQDGERAPRRRRQRGRYRAGEGREGEEAAPVEGFGDSVPAFVGNE
jgi:hypothetical protein